MCLKMSAPSARQKPAAPALMCSACTWKNCVILQVEAKQHDITWIKDANTGVFKGAFFAVSQSHPPRFAQLESFP